MHDSRKVFLLEDEPRCIKAKYEPDVNTQKPSKGYDFKTFDETIQVDDFIVVPTDTRYGMTVVKVVEVDVEPDLDTDLYMHWVIDKVDRSVFENLLASEEGFIDAARAAERKRKKKQLKEDLLADVDTTTLKLAGPAVEAPEEANE
jgi:hypothetical protein